MNATHLLLHRYRPGTGPQPGTPEHDEEMREWGEVDARLRASDTLVGAYALEDRGVRTSPEGDQPWSAEGEIVFAVHAIAVEDDAAASALARTMPTARYGTVEVRPLMEM